jgi:hypothetical protein
MARRAPQRTTGRDEWLATQHTAFVCSCDKPADVGRPGRPGQISALQQGGGSSTVVRVRPMHALLDSYQSLTPGPSEGYHRTGRPGNRLIAPRLQGIEVPIVGVFPGKMSVRIGPDDLDEREG